MRSPYFEKAIEKLLKIEGGYSHHLDDSGGKTRFGITEWLAREYGYRRAMKDLPGTLAKRIYYEEFWSPLKLDLIAKLDVRIAYELFDTAVNQSVPVAAKYLQRSLNVLNMRGEFYQDVKVDGVIGDKTLRALVEFRSVRNDSGIKVLLKMLNCLQGAFYVDLAERREKDESFVFGWMMNRVSMSDNKVWSVD